MAEEIFSMDFPSDPDKMPTEREVPLGRLEFKCLKLEAYHTKPKTDQESIAKGNYGNKLAFKLSAQVTQPDDYAGFFYSHDFYIGSNDDPEAKKESTWKRNATLMMKLLKKARVNLSGLRKVEEACAAIEGQLVGGTVKKEDGKPYVDRTSGERKMGRDKHIVRDWFEAGSLPYEVVFENGLANDSVTTSAERPAGLSADD